MSNHDLVVALVFTWIFMVIGWVCFAFILVDAIRGLERKIDNDHQA